MTKTMNAPQPRLMHCDCGDGPSYVGGLLRSDEDPQRPPPCDLCGNEGRCVVLDLLYLCEEHFRGMALDVAGWVKHLDDMAGWDAAADDGGIVVPYVPGLG